LCEYHNQSLLTRSPCGEARAPSFDGTTKMDASLVDLMPVRRGHFRYESGYHGEIWLDLDRLFLNPIRIAPLAHDLAQRLASRAVEAVVGPLVGGALLAEMIAVELGLEFAYTEPRPSSPKKALYPITYRLPRSVTPSMMGKRVAIVDDVINAGSAIRGTYVAVTEAGAKPTIVGALLVLGDAAQPFLNSTGMALERLATLPNPLWEPANCPLCAQGIPLDDGSSPL
jgi:orotate phosphoribosyltransferase